MRRFDEFGNVTARDEVKTEKSDLEKVLDVEKEIINQYEQDKRLDIGTVGIAGIKELYAEILLRTQFDLPTSISQEILQQYLDARENSEKNEEAKLRGIYSSILLERTCSSKKNVFLTGQNKRWSYLFYFLHCAQNISLESFLGDEMLLGAGCGERANVENISLRSMQGKNILAAGGAYKGSLKYVSLAEISGYGVLNNAGNEGNIDNVTLSNITGDDTLARSGRENGKIKHVSVTGIYGRNLLISAGGDDGKIDHISVNEVKCDENIPTVFGKKPMNNCLSWIGNPFGEVSHILLNDITGDGILMWAGDEKKKVKEVIIANSEGKDFLKGSHLENYSVYRKLPKNKQDLLDKIVHLTKTIASQDFAERKRMHDEIAQLQIRLFDEEKT